MSTRRKRDIGGGRVGLGHVNPLPPTRCWSHTRTRGGAQRRESSCPPPHPVIVPESHTTCPDPTRAIARPVSRLAVAGPTTVMDAQLLPFLAVTSVVMLVPGPSVLFAVTQLLPLWAGRRGARRVRPRVGVRDPRGGRVPRCLRVSSRPPTSSCGCCRSGEPPTSPTSASRHAARVRRPRHGRRRTRPEPTRRLARIYLAGLLVDLLNPKTVLFFVAVLPQFVDADAGSVPSPVARPRRVEPSSGAASSTAGTPCSPPGPCAGGVPPGGSAMGTPRVRCRLPSAWPPRALAG